VIESVYLFLMFLV